MKTKKILLIAAAVFVAILVIIMSVMLFTNFNSLHKGEEKVETAIYPVDDNFQTNLKDSRRIISLSVKVEIVEDKELLKDLDRRKPEMRSKILDIIRAKTIEEVDGSAGKQALEKEILTCVRSIFGKDRVVNVYIDDMVVQ